MSSAADTALSFSRISSVSFAELISGTTFCAAKFCFGSSRITKPFCPIAGSVVNRSAAWIVPSRSAATVSGPPASRGRKDAKVHP